MQIKSNCFQFDCQGLLKNTQLTTYQLPTKEIKAMKCKVWIRSISKSLLSIFVSFFKCPEMVGNMANKGLRAITLRILHSVKPCCHIVTISDSTFLLYPLMNLKHRLPRRACKWFCYLFLKPYPVKFRYTLLQ